MPYKKVIKVSDEVYGKLEEFKRKMGLPSANQVIKKLIEIAEFKVSGVTLTHSSALDVKVDEGTPYYVECPYCGKVAHFIRDFRFAGEKWYYCPRCDIVFRV